MGVIQILQTKFANSKKKWIRGKKKNNKLKKETEKFKYL